MTTIKALAARLKPYPFKSHPHSEFSAACPGVHNCRQFLDRALAPEVMFPSPQRLKPSPLRILTAPLKRCSTRFSKGEDARIQHHLARTPGHGIGNLRIGLRRICYPVSFHENAPLLPGRKFGCTRGTHRLWNSRRAATTVVATGASGGRLDRLPQGQPRRTGLDAAAQEYRPHPGQASARNPHLPSRRHWAHEHLRSEEHTSELQS